MDLILCFSTVWDEIVPMIYLRGTRDCIYTAVDYSHTPGIQVLHSNCTGYHSTASLNIIVTYFGIEKPRGYLRLKLINFD
jgi:hypothetical protein